MKTLRARSLGWHNTGQGAESFVLRLRGQLGGLWNSQKGEGTSFRTEITGVSSGTGIIRDPCRAASPQACYRSSRGPWRARALMGTLTGRSRMMCGRFRSGSGKTDACGRMLRLNVCFAAFASAAAHPDAAAGGTPDGSRPSCWGVVTRTYILRARAAGAPAPAPCSRTISAADSAASSSSCPR